MLEEDYCFSALAIAIIRKDIVTPEQAFQVLNGKRPTYSDEIVEDMRALHNSGTSYLMISKMYGVSKNKVFYLLNKPRRISS